MYFYFLQEIPTVYSISGAGLILLALLISGTNAIVAGNKRRKEKKVEVKNII
jgi:hypothetical protein